MHLSVQRQQISLKIDAKSQVQGIASTQIQFVAAREPEAI